MLLCVFLNVFLFLFGWLVEIICGRIAHVLVLLSEGRGGGVMLFVLSGRVEKGFGED